MSDEAAGDRWVAIDTGYEAPAVYSWSRAQGFGQVSPVKGVEGFNRSSPVSGPTFVDATEGGKRLRRGARLWTVAVSTFKAETYRFLRLERPTEEDMAEGAAFPPGSVHLPQWVENEWLKQFVAEQLVRNNPHAAKAVAVLVNNIIGAGIMPRAASGDDKLDRKVDALFERWTAECDADGQLDFYGLQTLICREMVEAGEVLVRRRLRRASDGFAVPLQLQVLEADFLDATRSSDVGAGRIVQGIEFDPVGKRRAYWLHPEHPGDAHGARAVSLGRRGM
jgi:hypothetical protein